uniref:Nucleotid_trans domain-containing protein n=1 Tax=Elaeophora elaphi TaxID=1147741 RepID=A0A0R3S516_9BILA
MGSQIAEIKIAVVTILNDLSNINEYQLAMRTFQCYCIYQRYEWIVIDVSRNDTLKLLCPQNQFFFQRHCVIAQFLEENNFDYVLFIDSDMGVINPKRRIEEYIMDNKDIIFYNRIWNFEVMAGSYLAKSYKDLFTYEACVRAQLETNEKWKKKISVLPKGQSWARDGWLTNSKWSEQDFIFHGWQKRRLNRRIFASWKLPFLSTKFNMSICGTSNYIENWKYNRSFARDPNEIRVQLNTIIALKDVEYYKEKRKAEKILANLMKSQLIWHNSTINSSLLGMPLNRKN